MTFATHIQRDAHYTPLSEANVQHHLMQSATGRRSSKDVVNARAVEQKRTAPAAFTLFCKMNGQPRTMQFRHSTGPTSAVRTTKRARPPSPDNSG